MKGAAAQVPRRPPFLALVGALCFCRGSGIFVGSFAEIGWPPAAGLRREKSGMALLCRFFIGTPRIG